MKYERLLLQTSHGYDGKEMILGKSVGNATEYDCESAICGLLSLLIADEKKRCEYLPKTKRQWEPPCRWKQDLPLTIRVSFAAKNDFLEGTSRPGVSEAFPRLIARGGDGETSLVFGRGTALQPVEITARDILRGLLTLL